MFRSKLFLSNLLFILIIFSFNVFAQDEAEKQGKEIFDKYQAAIGGKENLDKIKTVETITESERMGTKFRTTRIEDKVNKKNYTVTEGGIEGKQENGFDGKRSWTKSNFFRGYRDNSVVISNEKTKYKKLPNEKIDGKEYLVVNETTDGGSLNNKAYFDPETYLLFQRIVSAQISGMNINQTIIYSDYRKVGDILLPFKEITKTQMGDIINQKISVRHNIEVDPKIFEFSEESKKSERTDKKDDTSPKTPMMLAADSTTVYQDEEGKTITKEEFMQKRNSGNYSFAPQIVNGKLASMRLKKGAAETELGAAAPDFSSVFLDNSPVQLSQLKGKVVVLNFWFSGCAPCIKEIPELNELVKKYEGQDVEFISITYDPKDVAAEFIKKHNFKYKHIVDAQNIVDSYKVTAYPTHIVLDRDGKVKMTQFGYITGIVNTIDKRINESLAAVYRPEWDKKNPDAIVPEKIKKETFEKAWQIINDTHFDPTFNGVDWNGIKTKYEPELINVKTNQNLTDFLNKMVGELKQSHIKVHPAQVISINGAPTDAPKSGSIGVELRLLDNAEVAVTNVRKDSPAEKAGIKKGYVIKKVNDETVEIIVNKQKEKGGFQLRDGILAPRAVSGKLSGDLEKKVSVTFLDENGVEKTAEIERQSGNSRDLVFESKEIDADVGYIKFNLFFGDLLKKFEDAISIMQNKKALILDLRGNPGGVGNFTTAIAARLDSQKRSLGVSQYRYSKQEFAYEGNENSFKGKVFILIDETSASSAEVLAGGLQANKRAIVIGRNSVGAVLPSINDILPNGGALQHAIADFRTPDGKILEGRGVTPDIEINLTRQDLLRNKDLALETAFKLAKN